MIHALIWLAHLTNWQFVRGVAVILVIVAAVYGVVGLSILALLLVGDLGFWLLPGVFTHALSIWGTSVLIVGIVVGGVTLYVRVTRRTMSGYEAAVAAGDTTKWWRPTLIERWTGGTPRPWDDIRDGAGQTIVTDADRRAAAAGDGPRRYPSTANRRRAAVARSARRGMTPADEDDGT